MADARHQGYQDQLNTEALKIASQLEGRVDGMEKTMNLLVLGLRTQIDDTRKSIEDNRKTRDEQHAQGERHFEKLETSFGRFIEKSDKRFYTQLAAVLLAAISIIGYLVAHMIDHHL